MHAPTWVVAVVLLAGCGTPSPAETEAAEPVQEAGVRYEEQVHQGDGSFIGVDVLVAGLKPTSLAGPDDAFRFDVPAGSTAVGLSIEVEHVAGLEATVVIWPDGCSTASCQQRETTNGGAFEGTFVPRGGEWTIALFPPSPGAGQFTWSAQATVTAPL